MVCRCCMYKLHIYIYTYIYYIYIYSLDITKIDAKYVCMCIYIYWGQVTEELGLLMLLELW